MSIEEARTALLALARKPKQRIVEFTPEMPTEWCPTQVRNPDPEASGQVFTPSSAWDFIIERLEAGEHIEEVTLKKPPGRTGYVMTIDIGRDVPLLYVKLQLGSGTIIGRSFHYSKIERKVGNGSKK